MSESIHDGHRARMRQRFFEHGFEGFSDHEILELLLFFAIPRRDTNDLAHKILKEYKTLENILDADPHDLAEMKGVGENAAAFLAMIPELARLYEKCKQRKKELLYDTEQIGRYAVTLLKGETNEHFALICLDSNRCVHWSGIILEGIIDRIEAYPRRVMEAVIKHKAKTVIFAHNHPHGTLMPSVSDKEATRQLVEVLKGIDVTVLDHIIVSGNRFYSMAEMGFIF